MAKTGALMLGLLLTIMVSSCGRNIEPLRIATSKWPGYEFLSLAAQEGWLAADKIQIIESNSATEMLQALKAGRVVGATLTLDEVLRARDQGVALQVVMVFDSSTGGDAMLARRPVKELAELKGLRIGVERSAVGALLLSKVLADAGLSDNDVTIIDIPFEQQLAAWQTNQLDALVSYDPVVSQLEQQGALRILDSRDTPDLIIDVLAVRSDLAPRYTAGLRQLTAVHFRGLQRMRINPQDTAYRMAAHLGITGNEVLAIFRGMHLPNLAVNRQYLGPEGKVVQAARRLSGLLVESHLLHREATLTDLVSPHYLPVEN